MTESPNKPDFRAARAALGPTRIGDWVLYPDLGVLRGESGETRLNPKALHVLLVLLDAGDKGVSRDELLDRVWGSSYPSDNVISRAMADLRAAFGEKAGEQKYIRTLPKFGYQFVAEHGAIDDAPLARKSRVPTTHLGRYRHHYVLGAVLLLAWFLLPRLVRMPTPPDGPAIVLSGARPLTSAPGLEHQPRLVPGSDWVVHAVLRRNHADWDLFRVSLADGTSQPVAVTPGVSEHGPAVSPLGDEVAYVRLTTDGCEVVVQSIALGVPKSAAPCTTRFPTLVDWSPSGNALAYTAPQATDVDGRRRIYLVDIVTRELRRLTNAVSATGTDFYPRFSPGGGKLAFLRGEPQPDHRTTLWVVDVDTGEERQLTTLPAQLGGMAWLNEKRLVYSTLDAGSMRGSVISVDSGIERPIESNGFMHPDFRGEDATLVVAEPRSDRDMAIIGADRDATLVAQSTSDDHSGRLSADERWIAFVSRRSGYDELWIAATDGETTRRLTSFDGATVRYPEWSPDGEQILVTVQTDAGERLTIVDVVGGTAIPVETSFDDITTPRWIEDGWVGGCRDATGWGICVGDANGVRRIATDYYRPHPAGAGNIYVVDDAGALYNMAVTDGSVTKILDGMPANGRYGWEVDEGSLYLLAGGETGNSGRLMRVDIDGGEPQTLYTGAMPVADTTISIGRQSGNILLTLFQTSSDDLVVYENVVFD
jgi:Tol biopolymer transport system component/DNA-binding winged helix-turn-helix (wHTH) protein